MDYLTLGYIVNYNKGSEHHQFYTQKDHTNKFPWGTQYPGTIIKPGGGIIPLN